MMYVLYVMVKQDGPLFMIVFDNEVNEVLFFCVCDHSLPCDTVATILIQSALSTPTDPER